MTSDWKECKLGEVADVTKLAGFEFTKYIEYVDDGEIIALRALNLRNGVLDLSDIKRIKKSVSDSLSRSKLYINDILLTYTGNGYGDCAIIKENDKYHLAPNICKITPNKEIINPYYLYSYIRSSLFYKQMTNNMVGSGQPTIPMKTIRILNIPICKKEEQDKIARVLGAIDDKIELNNSINKNLEQQMQSIFLELFPFIFNNANDTLEKIISFSNGKKRPENMGTIPVYGGNGILAYSDSSNSENCVIVGRVGAYCGNTFLCTGSCWVSDNAIQAKSKIGDSQLFIFYILKNAHLQSRHIGTGQPLMTQGILNSIPFNMPDISIIKQFTDNCEPMQKLIIDNTIENERLTQLRDTLLPKLMNGEIDVDKVEV